MSEQQKQKEQAPAAFVCVALLSRKNDTPDLTKAYIAEAAQEAARMGIDTAIIVRCRPFSIAQARNESVSDFLANDKFSHLLFVDQDVLLPSDAIWKLASYGTIAAGCVPVSKKMGAYMLPRLNIAESIDWSADQAAWAYSWFDGFKCVPAVGAGCLMIPRNVFKDWKFPWFIWPADHDPSVRHGEDFEFCREATKRGFPIYAVGDVRCGHNKEIDIASLIPEEGAAKAYRGPLSEEHRKAVPLHGTHQGVLRELSRLHADRIASIVEFGAGPHSTPLLEELFPLASLTSYESNLGWSSYVRHLCQRELTSIVHEPLAGMLAVAQNCEHADLFFVDCADDPNGYPLRTQITRILLDRFPGSFIVCHDVERWSDFPRPSPKHRQAVVITEDRGIRTALISNHIGRLFDKDGAPCQLEHSST